MIARNNRLELIDLELQRVAAVKSAKADRIRAEDQTMVDQLCAASNVESSEDNVANCTLEQLSKYNAPELRSWILARHPTHRNKKDINHLKVGRSKAKALEDAKLGVVNLLFVAYSVRDKKSRLLAVPNEEEEVAEDEPSSEDTSIGSPHVIRVFLRPQDFTVQPSSILVDSSKIKALIAIFDPDDRWGRVKLDQLSDIETTVLLKKADTLFALLQARLKHHIQHKVDPSQHSNRCLPWAEKNLAIVAMYMILFDHLMPNINGRDASQCLLRNPAFGSKFLPCANAPLSNFGCYLHYDPTIETLIRSGSAAGEGGIGKRLEGHVKKAKAARNDDDSRLYETYPSAQSIRVRSDSTTYEQLAQYIAASFSADAVKKGELSKDYQTNGGLFLYTKDDAKWISGRFEGRTMVEKYIQINGCLFV